MHHDGMKAQVYGGVVHMDFSGTAPAVGSGATPTAHTQHMPVYTPLDPRLVPRLLLVWHPDHASHSGKVRCHIGTVHCLACSLPLLLLW